MATLEQETRIFKGFGKSRKKSAPKVVVTPEGAIVNACIKWLWAHGIKARRQNTGAHKKEYTRKDGTTGASWIRYGKKGAGDFIFCLKPHGRYGEIECKT